MALELLVDVYQLPRDRLYVTYFGGDHQMGLEPDVQSRDIWLRLGSVFTCACVLSHRLRDAWRHAEFTTDRLCVSSKDELLKLHQPQQKLRCSCLVREKLSLASCHLCELALLHHAGRRAGEGVAKTTGDSLLWTSSSNYLMFTHIK